MKSRPKLIMLRNLPKMLSGISKIFSSIMFFVSPNVLYIKRNNIALKMLLDDCFIRTLHFLCTH